MSRIDHTPATFTTTNSEVVNIHWIEEPIKSWPLGWWRLRRNRRRGPKFLKRRRETCIDLNRILRPYGLKVDPAHSFYHPWPKGHPMREP